MAAIVARSLGKRFGLRGGGQPRTFRQFVEGGWRRRGQGTFWALRDVSFEVARGEMLGVIGHNGSGKSTLLRLLGGVMHPDEGTVETTAPVTGLLDLNAGMHPDLSGRDNAVISGVVQGLLRSEIEARLGDIFAFAGLEAFASAPFRTYSSGMRLRLGFAVAAHADPRILLVDEVLAVGDLAFQRKCLDRVRQFRDQGCAVVLISHDLGQVEELCDRALWLDHGGARGHGAPGIVAGGYRAAMMAETARRTPVDLPDAATAQGVSLRVGENRYGSLEAEISDVRLRDGAGQPVDVIASGGALTVEVALNAPQSLAGAHLSVAMADMAGVICLDLNTDVDRVELPGFRGAAVAALTIDRLDLAPGQYRLSVGVWHPGWSHAFDFHEGAYELVVTGGAALRGVLAPPHRWTMLPKAPAGADRAAAAGPGGRKA